MRHLGIALLTLISVVILAQNPKFEAKDLIVVNGGQFGNPQFDVNLTIHDLTDSTISESATLGAQSLQYAIAVDDTVFVAAQDSIAKYNVKTGKILARQAFSGTSTYNMALSEDKLIVTNWFNESSHQVKIFSRSNLDSLADIAEVVENESPGVAVFNNKAYVGQSNGAMAWLAVIDLDSLKFEKRIDYPITETGGGILFNYNDKLITLATAAIIEFDPVTESFRNLNFTGTIESISYRTQHFVDGDTLYCRMNNAGIGTYNLASEEIITDGLVNDEDGITAFTVDSTTQEIYITQTDFSSFKRGKHFSASGDFIDTFEVGFSPEAIVMRYDTIAVEDTNVINIHEIVDDLFSVAPVPFKHQLVLSTDQPLKISVTNVAGEEVYSNTIQSTTVLPTADWNSGLYFISAIRAQQIQHLKVIK